MEHFRLIRLVILGIAMTMIMGCRSEDPAPEARDLIYRDLKLEAESTQSALETAKLAKVEAYEKMRAAPAQTMDLKDAEKEYWKSVKLVDGLTIAAEYLQIRAERRRVESRLSYRKAFAAKKEDEWPSQTEYSAYLLNKRLRESALTASRKPPATDDKREPATESASEE